MPRKKKVEVPALYQAWLRAEQYQYGLNEKQAVSVLNAMTGMHYKPNRIYEWKNRVRDIPQTARAHMIKRTLRTLLFEHRVNAKQEQCDQVAEILGS